jgi:hypothetical protein
MAAGLGFKTFTTGEVLTAADVNGYLMQGILVFATEAARNSAITSPQEGQFAFTKDNNSLWYYTGSAWVASGAAGDIEGVTAGVGISGGGTSGTVTITNDMATTITASGDIVVGTGSGTYDNLPIGSTGQVLTADTTVSPYKVKWATPAAAGFVGCKLTKSVDQTIINVTNTIITFDGEDFDTDNFHNNSTNNSRITIPSGKGGKYLFVISGNFVNAGTTGHLQTNMSKNGSAVAAGAANIYWKNVTDVVGFTMSHILDAAATDYFEFSVYSNPGNNNGYITDTTRFSCEYLGA